MEFQNTIRIDEEKPVIKESTKVASSEMAALKPSGAFIGASWFSLAVGVASYWIALWNSGLELSQKGFYFTVQMMGLFAVISVQKSVRDRLEGIKVTDIYYGISWFFTIGSIVLMSVGLWQSGMTLSERGFYGIAFLMSMFAAVAVQKNTRDKLLTEEG